MLQTSLPASVGFPTSFPFFTRQRRILLPSPLTTWSPLATNTTAPLPMLRSMSIDFPAPFLMILEEASFYSALDSLLVTQLSYFDLLQLIPLLRDCHVTNAGLPTLFLVSVSHPPIALCAHKFVTAGWKS